MQTNRIDGEVDVMLALERARIERAYARREDDDRYTLSDPTFLLMCQEREAILLRLLADHGYASLAEAKILEVGCGTGHWLRDFIRWGAQPENVWGVDLLSQRIAQARELCPAGVTLTCQDATSLDVPDGSFNLVIQATVFTSILKREVRQLLASEMLRVLRPDGMIIWYDFRVYNPKNPDVRGVTREEIAQLFANCKVVLQKITLAPPLGRCVAPVSPSLYSALSRIKPLCTHYLGAITKP